MYSYSGTPTLLPRLVFKRDVAIVSILAGITVGVSAGALGATAPREQPVRRTAAVNEYRPVVGSGYLAWAQAGTKGPRRLDVYIRRLGGGRAVRINPSGTQGIPGAIFGRRLVYERWSARGQHDLQFVDLRTTRRSAPPGGVNTAASEVAPALSGNWLAFTRIARGEHVVLARNLQTGKEVEILRGRWARASQVSGRYVVIRSSDLFRYDLRTRTLERLESPGIPELWVTAASVTMDGTVYVAWQEMNGCDGMPTTLLRFRPGDVRGVGVLRTDALISSLYALAGRRTVTLYYDRVTCTPRRLLATSDLYRLVDR